MQTFYMYLIIFAEKREISHSRDCWSSLQQRWANRERRNFPFPNLSENARLNENARSSLLQRWSTILHSHSKWEISRERNTCSLMRYRRQDLRQGRHVSCSPQIVRCVTVDVFTDDRFKTGQLPAVELDLIGSRKQRIFNGCKNHRHRYEDVFDFCVVSSG